MSDIRPKLSVKWVDEDSDAVAQVVALADNLAGPAAGAVAAFAMVFDGANWDRAPGDSADGLLVNLGSNNDVSISGVVDTELPAAAALTDDFANPTAPGVGAFGMLWDGATWDRMKGDATDGVLVNLGTNNDVTFSGSVDTELPAAAALADGAANPTVPGVGAFGMYYNGATWDRMLGDLTDGLLVNLGSNNAVTISGVVDTELPAAAALSDAFSNPTAPAVGAFGMVWDDGGGDWKRQAGDANGRVEVVGISGFGSDAPTNPTTDTDSATDTAAGSPSDLDSAEITEAEFLDMVIVSAAVDFKVQIKAVEDGTPRNLSGLLFGKAGSTVTWKPPHRLYAAHAGAAAGLDVFRATVTNMDQSQASDLHASFYYGT